MNSHARFPGMLILGLVVVLGNAACAFAQQTDPNQKIVNELTRDLVNRQGRGSQNFGMMYNYKPLFRESVTTNGEENINSERKKAVEIGVKETHDQNVPIRPMQGFMQVADSEDVAKMVKGMIKMKVPVLYQTMMMVENGAATGFIGAMSNVNGLLDSTMQASQLQFAMYQALDPDGGRARNYGKAIFDGLQVQSHNNSWPMALWAANVDELDPQKAHAAITGGNITHQYKKPTNQTAGPGVNPIVKKDDAGAINNTKDKGSLFDTLFEPLGVAPQQQQ